LLYDSNPLIRAIVQLAISPVPYGIGSAIDAALTSKIENIAAVKKLFHGLG